MPARVMPERVKRQSAQRSGTSLEVAHYRMDEASVSLILAAVLVKFARADALSVN